MLPDSDAVFLELDETDWTWPTQSLASVLPRVKRQREAQEESGAHESQALTTMTTTTMTISRLVMGPEREGCSGTRSSPAVSKERGGLLSTPCVKSTSYVQPHSPQFPRYEGRTVCLSLNSQDP